MLLHAGDRRRRGVGKAQTHPGHGKNLRERPEHNDVFKSRVHQSLRGLKRGIGHEFRIRFIHDEDRTSRARRNPIEKFGTVDDGRRRIIGIHKVNDGRALPRRHGLLHCRDVDRPVFPHRNARHLHAVLVGGIRAVAVGEFRSDDLHVRRFIAFDRSADGFRRPVRQKDVVRFAAHVLRHGFAQDFHTGKGIARSFFRRRGHRFLCRRAHAERIFVKA